MPCQRQRQRQWRGGTGARTLPQRYPSIAARCTGTPARRSTATTRVAPFSHLAIPPAPAPLLDPRPYCQALLTM